MDVRPTFWGRSAQYCLYLPQRFTRHLVLSAVLRFARLKSRCIARRFFVIAPTLIRLAGGFGNWLWARFKCHEYSPLYVKVVRLLTYCYASECYAGCNATNLNITTSLIIAMMFSIIQSQKCWTIVIAKKHKAAPSPEIAQVAF